MKIKDDFDDLTITIKSKKLVSGKYQVRFEVKDHHKTRHFGYVLADINESPGEIMKTIYNFMHIPQEKQLYDQGFFHSVALGQKKPDIMIFNQKDSFK